MSLRSRSIVLPPPRWGLLQWQHCLHRCATACPSTSPGRGSATLSRWTLHPCTQVFNLRSSFHNNNLLSILLAKKRIGSRLAWMSGCCKKLQSHLVHFQLQLTPSLPLSIPIVYTSSTWSNMSNSSLATTILSRSLESTTKMMPWWKMSR